ncbi:MAG TPA: 4Fe-4S dicluster domain-containing protein [Candidatus Sulfomarinibacteraceae bacterium]|nr:4Fe-4S dicluster domain-containing protein [Candidatus Sulfomarinibacteraceae bacterium]
METRETSPPAAISAVAEQGLPRAVSRRTLLRSLAAVGAGASLAAIGATGAHVSGLVDLLDVVSPAHASADQEGATRRWAMVIDLRRCDGCEKCTEACQTTHYLEPEQTWLKVYNLHTQAGTEYFMPRLCMHCEDAPCLRVCPVGASFKTAGGTVLVDQDRCIGCRLCMAACPYEARYFNWIEPTRRPPLPVVPTPEFPAPQRKGTVGKCTFCVHQTSRGELPACVTACSMEAIYIGDLDADVATNGAETVRLSTFLREHHALRYREELNTGPRVWYILGHGEDLGF